MCIVCMLYAHLWGSAAFLRQSLDISRFASVVSFFLGVSELDRWDIGSGRVPPYFLIIKS